MFLQSKMAEKWWQACCRVWSQNVGEARCQSENYYAESVFGGGATLKYYAEITIKQFNCMYEYYAEMLVA